MAFFAEYYFNESTEYFEMYLKAIHTHVDAEKKRLEDMGDEPYRDDDTGLVTMEPSAAYELYELHNLKKIMLRTFSVGVIMSIETMLADLCRRVQKDKKQIFSYSDISGSRGIGQTKKYLKKMLDLDVPTDQDNRSFLDAALCVRNATIHSDSNVKDDAAIKTIKNFDKKYPGLLKIKEHDATTKLWLSIEITFDYAKKLVELNKNICKEVSRLMAPPHKKTHDLLPSKQK